MNVGKLCGFAVILVIVIPLLVGIAWPNDQHTEEVYEYGDVMDITQQIATSTIPLRDVYNGPLNNNVWLNYNNTTGEAATVYWPIPNVTTSSATVYPYSAEPSASQSMASVSPNDWYNDPDTVRVDITGDFTVSGRTGTYTAGMYYPGTDVLLAMAMDMYGSVSISQAHNVMLSGDMTVKVRAMPSTFADPAYGWTEPSGANVWTNGFNNSEVEFWLLFPETGNVHADFDFMRVSQTESTGNITVSNLLNPTQDPQTIGNAYEWVSVRLNYRTNEITVSGLIGASYHTDTSYHYGNSVTMAMALQTGPRMITFADIGSTIQYSVKSTVSEISSTKGILDATIDPRGYLDAYDWVFRIYNPAQFGDAITIGGTTYSVATGSISFTSGGETQSIAVRDLVIMHLQYGDTAGVYFSGKKVDGLTSSDDTITMFGPWWASVRLAPVNTVEKEKYDWELSAFSLETPTFCFVGLISCVGVAVAAGLWGKRTGSKLLPLYITLACCAGGYIAMM